MPLIRSVFQDELDNVSQTLFDLSVMVSDSMARATKSVMTKDLKLAEEVITSDEKIDTVQHDLDARIIDIIARQQPVASDLRALVTALRMSADLERMGDLAHHVAKLVRLRHPESAVPAELSHYGVTAFELMSCVASCGCCVEVGKWSETGDPTVWFEVWWLWFSHHTTIRQLAE